MQQAMNLTLLRKRRLAAVVRITGLIWDADNSLLFWEDGTLMRWEN
ncbi:MAG: hypothetical protein M1438_09550 [Deltaproteobacteria bacterium]|nr:hypothetical protein [Deltaproteobacteria bacterium]